MPTGLWDSLWSGREESVGLYKSWATFRERQQGKLERKKHRKTKGKGLLRSVTPNTGLPVSPCWISSGWCWLSAVQVPLNKQPPAHWLLAVICNSGILHHLLQVTDKCYTGQMLFFPAKRQYRITPILLHLIKKIHYYLDFLMVLIYFETIWLVNVHFLHCFCLFLCSASPYIHASYKLEIRSRTKSTMNITNFHPRQEVSAMSSCHSRQENPQHCCMHWVTQNWQGHMSQPPEPSRPTHLRRGTELKGS